MEGRRLSAACLGTVAVFLICLSLPAGSASDPVCSKPMTLTASEGEINSESFPYSAPENVTCVWQFNIDHPEQPVMLTFDNFWLADDDIFTVAVGKDVMKKYTGIKEQFSVAFAAQGASVTFKTSSKKGERHFHATYSSSKCKFVMTATQAVIESPDYIVTNSSNQLNCTWVLVSMKKIAMWSLSFVDLKLGANVIQVYNDGTLEHVVAKYTGNDVHSDLIVGSLQIVVQLTLQLQAANASFRAEFLTISKECATVQNVNASSISLSPPPHPWTDEQTCVWILEGEESSVFSLDIHSELHNPADSIIVNDGLRRYNASIASFGFGSDGARNADTSSNKLYVFYSTIVTRKLSTFNITARRKIDGGRHTSNGTFQLPKDFPNNQSIIFNLVADPGRQVEATLTSKLKPGNVVRFYEFVDDDRRDIATFDEKSTAYPVFSMSDRLVVEAVNFTKKDELNGNFTSITRGCDQIDNLMLGSYHLNKYMADHCTWLIKPKEPEDRLVFIIFNSLNLKSDGIVTVYRGLAASSEKKLASFNSSLRYLPNVQIAAMEGVRIDTTFGDKAALANHSYMSAFYSVMPGCVGVRNLTSGNMTLQSPGYPTRYPLNANCSWEINFPAGKSVMLNFTDVDVYPSDEFVIYARNASSNASSVVFNATGHEKPDDVVVKENITFVWTSRLSNSDLVPVRGFSLDLLLLDGGESVTSDSGSILIPGKALENANGTVQCIWKIKVPGKPKKDVAYSVEFSYTEPPKGAAFEVHDGSSLSFPVFPSNKSSLLSRYDTITVQFTIANATGHIGEMTLKFDTQACEKKDQCDNGICLHTDWRCNGKNECGDWSDEKNCNESITVIKGVSKSLFAVGIIVSLIVGAVLALVSPIAFRKIRAYRQRYHDFHTLPEE